MYYIDELDDCDWIIELSRVTTSLPIKPTYTVDYNEKLVIFQLKGLQLMLKHENGLWYYRILNWKYETFYHLTMPESPAVLTLSEFLNNLCEQLKG